MTSNETQTPVEDSQQSPSGQCHNRQLIAKFSGHKTVIRADLWLNLFEVVTRGKDDSTRVFTMMTYLVDDALNWFAAEIAPRLDDIKWSDVREHFIARFGPAIANPLVESQHRRLRTTENVNTYYEDKMRILRRVTLNELDVVAQLTEGMPPNYRGYLLCANPKTATAWLAVALQLEATLGRPPRQDQREFKGRQKTHVALTAQDRRQYQQAVKPQTPCRFCLDAGETAFHWHRDCKRRHRAAANSAAARRANAQPVQQAAASNSDINAGLAAAHQLQQQPLPTATNSMSLTTQDVQGNFPGGRH